MNKDLPKVYASPIDKKFTNNNDIYYGKSTDRTSTVNVFEKINQIFASPYHVYKSNVLIKTRNKYFLFFLDQLLYHYHVLAKLYKYL